MKFNLYIILIFGRQNLLVALIYINLAPPQVKNEN